MTTLAQMLSKRLEIINLVKLFGYSGEVQIHYEGREEGQQKIKLKFVVYEIAGQSVPHDNEAFLEAKLSEVLDSEVEVTASNYIPELKQYDTNRKSALISDERAIKEVIYRIDNDIHDDRVIEDDALDTIKFENIKLEDLHKTDKLFLGVYFGLIERRIRSVRDDYLVFLKVYVNAVKDEKGSFLINVKFFHKVLTKLGAA